tara:strand:- start:3619 stop:3810 length:192 start_codon:yes stop_codon:yes gene_type:complete
MGLLDKLTAGNTSFGFNGAKPTSATTAGGNNAQTFFKGSNLDLDGQTPTKYADTAPENQGGRV